MKLMTRSATLIAATACALASTAIAGDVRRASHEELAAELAELQARAAQLQRQHDDDWLTEARAAEIRSLVQDVLADADTRASLLSSGMISGYDNGFVIGDPAGDFMLRINGQIQARWMWNRQRDAVNQVNVPMGPGEPIFGGMVFGTTVAGDFDDGDRHRSGFENTRTKLWFTGHILGPEWQYHVEADFGQGGPGQFGQSRPFTLLDAWIAHHNPDTNWVAAIGQFKLPFLYEELVDSRYQQAVERSLINSIFTAGRSQGIMISNEWETVRIFGAFSNGMRRVNMRSLDYSTEFALTGRMEFLGVGEWAQFNEFRSMPGEEFGFLVGLAGHWERDEFGTDFDDITEIIAATLDVSAKFGGWNLFGAAIFHHFDMRGVGNGQSWAWVAQGGFHFTDDWEVFGRYEQTHWDSDLRDGGLSNISILTAGVNHYMLGAGHSAKLTVDAGYAFNRIELADHRTGWRADELTEGRGGQFLVRTQIQLAF